MKKANRQAKIIELITNRRIETQEELADLLLGAGIHVTQATISRDIRELHITKVAGPGGRQYYTVLQAQSSKKSEKFSRVLKDGFHSMDLAQNILVIKTVEGMAMAVAAALDNLKWDEIIGCIAGDDTIFCAVRSTAEAAGVMEKLRSIIEA